MPRILKCNLRNFHGFHKGRIWCFNILGDNERSISHILRIDIITVGYILLTTNLVVIKRENSKPIFIAKKTELRLFIDYSGLCIEVDPSREGKRNIFFFHIGYLPRPSSLKLHI